MSQDRYVKPDPFTKHVFNRVVAGLTGTERACRYVCAATLVAPSLECAAEMGTNFMDRAPRHRVLSAGYRQGLALASGR